MGRTLLRINVAICNVNLRCHRISIIGHREMWNLVAALRSRTTVDSRCPYLLDVNCPVGIGRRGSLNLSRDVYGYQVRFGR